MNMIFGLIFLFVGWKFGDWRHLKKYYPTILYFIIGDLLYNVLTYEHVMWNYNEDGFFPNHTLTNLWIMITVYPATVITYLAHFPQKRMFQAVYILLWVTIYACWELLNIYVFGIIEHFNEWNMWWSFLFDIIIFVMLVVHHKRPLLAWGLSVVIIVIFLRLFDVNTYELH
jgi:hypothetical protein